MSGQRLQRLALATEPDLPLATPDDEAEVERLRAKLELIDGGAP